MSGAPDRLPRLLALVPWLLAHPGTPVAQVAREFGVTERQLRDDLMLIFMCGLPGYGPGDLMEVVYEGDRVALRNADTISRPLRLTGDEALALVVALRTLAALPGRAPAEGAPTDGAPSDGVDRALAKLETAAGQAAEAGARVTVAVDAEAEVLGAVRTALERGRRVHLRYYVPGRDETTERDVDPIRMLVAGGRAYLQGWCRRVEDVRTFRLDRVFEIEVLDVPAAPPVELDPPDELFVPGDDDEMVTLELDPRARWVADYYPCESVVELPEGRTRVRLRARDPAWLRRLALGLAGSGRVVGPPRLAAAVRADALAALASYQLVD